MDQKKIGEFITRLRKEKGLTQEELADKLKVSSKSVSRWETGVNMPDYSVLNSICNEFDINVLELLNGEKKKENNKVFEEYMEYKDRMNRRKRVFLISLGFLLIIVSLLSIYFINNFKKVIVYKFNGESENFNYDSGLLVSSNIKYILHYGKVSIKDSNYIKEEDIIDIQLAYKEDSLYYFITTFVNDSLISESYGYGEIFNDNKLSYIPDNLFIVVFYKKDNVINHEEIKINAEKILINDKFFYKKDKYGFEKNNDPKEIDFNSFDKSTAYREYLLTNGFIVINGNNYHTMCTANCLEKKLGSSEYIALNYLVGEVSYYYEDSEILIKVHSSYDISDSVQIRYSYKKDNKMRSAVYGIKEDKIKYYNSNDNISKINEFVELFNKYRMVI